MASSMPHSSGDKKETAAAAGGNTLLLVGGVAALAGLGYYFTRSTEPSTQDIKKEARDLKDVTEAKGVAVAEDAKVWILWFSL